MSVILKQKPSCSGWLFVLKRITVLKSLLCIEHIVKVETTVKQRLDYARRDIHLGCARLDTFRSILSFGSLNGNTN